MRFSGKFRGIVDMSRAQAGGENPTSEYAWLEIILKRLETKQKEVKAWEYKTIRCTYTDVSPSCSGRVLYIPPSLYRCAPNPVTSKFKTT